MKTTHCFKHVFTILLMSFFCLASCSKKEDTKNQCENTNCINGQLNETTCECMCDQGYVGKNCEKTFRDNFIGTYVVIQSCVRDGEKLEDVTYKDTIRVRGDNFKNIEFLNFISFPSVGINTPVSATVNETDLTIPEQTFGLAKIQGSGVRNENIITINYTMTSALGNDTCTLKYTKK